MTKARWIIKLQDIQSDKEEISERILADAKKRNIPSKVSYVDGDNRILIDFSNDEHIKLLVQFIKKFKKIIVEEFLFTKDNSIVRDKQLNSYANEIIIPFRIDKERENTRLFHNLEKSNYVQRSFIPGSQWLYIKIYAGIITLEKILKTVIKPLIDIGEDEKYYKHFFFIRYRDELSHLRIRFYNDDPNKQSHLLALINEKMNPLVENGTIHKVSIDTYQRELERYTAKHIEKIELLFYNDSLAILNLISLIDDQDDEFKLYFALRGIDALLSDFGLDLSERARVINKLAADYSNGFGGGTLQKEINVRYRKYKDEIFMYMDNRYDLETNFHLVTDIFGIRSSMNSKVISEMLLGLSPNEVADTLQMILPSIIHMFMNRLFSGHQNTHELVIYTFLDRYYTSQVKIKKAQFMPS